MQTLLNWNGDDVILAKSKGGVLAFTEPLEGLLRGDVEVWPAPEILQELYKSNHEAKYESEDPGLVDISFEPDQCRSKMQEGDETTCEFVIASGNASTPLEFVDEAFDDVATWRGSGLALDNLLRQIGVV